tara:strand:- start:78 stop:485 length:408 start_codon:yes stop_codon:yes gene_type:complete
MKKLVLMVVVVLTSLCASAQYTVVSNVDFPTDSESWATENITNSMGIGYSLDNGYMIGLRKSGDDYDMFVRYNMNNNLYVSADLPKEDTFENARVGVGYSISFWGNMYVEPNYSISLDSEVEDGGKFSLGISYKL